MTPFSPLTSPFSLLPQPQPQPQPLVIPQSITEKHGVSQSKKSPNQEPASTPDFDLAQPAQPPSNLLT